jgi:predicted peroxiredoxin/TusA-related sulfurtransferase
MQTTNRKLERRGKSISTFIVYDAVQHLEGMADGDVLELLTDDLEPLRADIASWCGTTGHRLIADEPVAGGRQFLIEKRPAPAKDTRLAMVISNEGLEELLSPLGFALAAALEGIEVHLYVQGPAVRVLSRGFQPKLKGWARPFSRFAANGMARTGHIPAQEKIQQLRSLGGHIYMCGPSMDHFKVKKEDLIFDDLPLVEYLTFMAAMEKADIHIYN